MIKIVILLFCFFAGSFSWLLPVNSETSEYQPVKYEIPDQNRINEIALLLSDQPKGLGEPCKIRQRWDKLKNSGKYSKVLAEADKVLQQGIPAWNEELYMGFFTRGDSQSGKDLVAARIRAFATLVWAECLDNSGKYVPAIEQALKEILAQKTWVNPRNYSEENFGGLVELSTAGYAHNIAQALYLLGDKLHPEIREQALAGLYQRAFIPLMRTFKTQNEDHTWLIGTNNWNAVCLAGVTGAALTVIKNKNERATFVAIAERYIKNFVSGFLDDGYCTEGLSYFNYGFGRYITLRENILQSTDGKLDLFRDNPKLQKIAWFLPNMEIINGVYPAIADCRTGTQPSAGILRYLSKRLDMGLRTYETMSLEGRANDLMEDIIYVFDDFSSQSRLQTAGRNGGDQLRAFFNVAGVLTLRPAETHEHSMGVLLKGGNNNEHHNHNDLGSFTIVAGNEIMIGDPGSIPYTAKTFSAQRYEYRTIGSYGHPVPLVGGKQQRAGVDAQAKILKTDFTDQRDFLSMDLSSAYDIPGTLIREFSYSRGKTEELILSDCFSFPEALTFETSLITGCKWERISANQLVFEGDKEKLIATIAQDAEPFSIESEEISEEGGTPYTRLGIRLKSPLKKGKLTITFKTEN